MRRPQGMEAMVFSFAYYKVKNYEKVIFMFEELHNGGLFAIDRSRNKEMSGSFIQDYPKNHWNPLAQMAGAKQVLGGAEVKNGVLKIDTKTKSALNNLRKLLESTLSDSIEFEREEFQEVMELLRKDEKRNR